MGRKTWQFEALDTLFFKESRPIDSVGAAQLASQFPPPVRTLVGAIRTAIGDQLGGDWQGYKQACLGNQLHPLKEAIGTPDSLGPLSFGGPWLAINGERLYPMPLIVLRGEGGMARLQPGNIVQTDLGQVCLPEMQPALAGAKPLDGAFVNAAGVQRIMAAESPQEEQIYSVAGDGGDKPALFHHEERLGIARDNRSRVTGDGLLYQTRHIRPAPGLVVELDVGGAAEHKSAFVRLGAEGRLAHVSNSDARPVPELPIAPQGATGLLLVLLTPALFANGWLPDGLHAEPCENQTFWQGELHSVGVKLVCSVVGKPLREGGWDMVNHMPRPLAGMVPAGSCYFVELDEGVDLQLAARQLHGKQIGKEQEWGRGLLAVGFWKK